MQQVTLCLPVTNDGQVLLGLKRRGFGQGKVVGLGGKIEPGEDLRSAAVRELYEESGLLADPGRLELAARLTFHFPSYPAWNHRMHVFIVRAWRGEIAESDEITPQWHPLAALPLGQMWDDGRLWLPRVLAGERLAMTCVYGPDLETVAALAWEELAPS